LAAAHHHYIKLLQPRVALGLAYTLPAQTKQEASTGMKRSRRSWEAAAHQEDIKHAQPFVALGLETSFLQVQRCSAEKQDSNSAIHCYLPKHKH
jgi:hypothetical protein